MPINQHVRTRIDHIADMLVLAYGSGATLSNSTKGAEREYFISHVFNSVLPPSYRCGRGDITDVMGNKSGQLDCVIEHGFSPSFPALGATERLYLAEGVSTVVEVKSNVCDQWDEVIRTAKNIQPLRRRMGAVAQIGAATPMALEVPLLAVGYKGWKTLDTLQKKVEDAQKLGLPIECVACIEEGLLYYSPLGDANYSWKVTESRGAALWALVSIVVDKSVTLAMNSFGPINYMMA
jgi:hypothetical protein